jgi:ribonuclease E
LAENFLATAAEPTQDTVATTVTTPATVLSPAAGSTSAELESSVTAPDLSGNLAQAGLIMVQTSHPAPAVSFEPLQPLGRKPKPRLILPSEPLQMIETKQD